MILSILRVLVGFAIACIAAAVVQLGFAIPTDLFSGEIGKLTWSGEQVLLAATHCAVFSAPFALVSAAIGEWQSIRSWVYYVLSGIAIAIAGFIALYSGETPGPSSIVNSYALAAYLSAGLVGGYAYHLVAGRLAGEPTDFDGAPASDEAADSNLGGSGRPPNIARNGVRT